MYERRKAIVIGASNYEDSNYKNLLLTRNNASRIYKRLISLGYDVATDDKLIGTVNYIDMERAIKGLFRNKNIESNNTLLPYYCGYISISYRPGYTTGLEAVIVQVYH
jgi:hypothetical protein